MRKVADEGAKSGGAIKPRGRDTISAFAESWLNREKRPNLAPSTYAVYEVAWRVHANRRLQTAKAEGHKSEFVFTDGEGRFLGQTYLRRRHFEKVCKAAGISGVHPHDLRHTMTSHAIAAGLSPIVVARRLGHGSTRMTLDRYGHQLPGAQAEASAVLEKRLGADRQARKR